MGWLRFVFMGIEKLSPESTIVARERGRYLDVWIERVPRVSMPWEKPRFWYVVGCVDRWFPPEYKRYKTLRGAERHMRYLLNRCDF